MKIRTGFVSNSSSSSFIVIGQKPKYCKSIQLDEVQTDNIITFITSRSEEPSDIAWEYGIPAYLTPFLPDTGDQYRQAIEDKNAYEYHAGEHGGPYDEEGYDCIWQGWDDICEDIWIWKEDNSSNKNICPACGRPFED